MIYLLDTNILVLMARGLKIHKHPTENQRRRQIMANRIVRRAQQSQQAGDVVALSAITVAELEFGAWNSEVREHEAEAVRRAIMPFTLLAFDARDCAAQYGRIRHLLESRGKGIG